MKSMKTFTFDELSVEAKEKAVTEYLKDCITGITKEEAYEALPGSDYEYFEDGSLNEENL